MARLWYRPTPADFVTGLGAEAEMLDASEDPLSPQRFGRTVVVPLTADAFDVYTDAALTTLTTDLLDAGGAEIDQWVSSTDFATLGRGPAIQGPDGHEGPLYLSADGVIGYRIEPDSGPLYARMAAAEAPKATTDLSDWSATPPTDGQITAFDDGTGKWTPTSAGAPAFMPVVVVYNGTAWPSRASVVGTAPFVWWIYVVGATTDPADATGVDIIDRIPA